MTGSSTHFADLLLVAAGLSANNFAAALGLALSASAPSSRRQTVAWFIGFEVALLAVGLAVGGALAGPLGTWTRVAAGILLILVGLDSRRQKPGPAVGRGRLASSALAASLDSLGAGVALGARQFPLITALPLVAAVTAALTLLGLVLGKRAGARAPAFSRNAGAALLALVGVAILAGWL